MATRFEVEQPQNYGIPPNSYIRKNRVVSAVMVRQNFPTCRSGRLNSTLMIVATLFVSRTRTRTEMLGNEADSPQAVQVFIVTNLFAFSDIRLVQLARTPSFSVVTEQIRNGISMVPV